MYGCLFIDYIMGPPTALIYQINSLTIIILFIMLTPCSLKKEKPVQVILEIKEILLNQITSFITDSFKGDDSFVQIVDKVNKTTHYQLVVDSEDGPHVYTRQADDSRKNVIVLGEEDKLVYKQDKKVFVVLKKNPSSSTYFGEMAFIRPAVANRDDNFVSLNGVDSVVEWGHFDEHLIPGRTPISLMAFQCVSSIIVPCIFNPKVSKDASKFRSKPFTPKKSDISSTEASIFILDDKNANPNGNYDFYIDLELNAGDSKGFGAIDAYLDSESGQLGTKVHNLLCIAGGGEIEKCNEDRDRIERRKRTVSIISHAHFPGWQTQYAKVTNGTYSSHNDTVFFGLGNCPATTKIYYHKLLSNNLATTDSTLDYYLNVLRADCLPMKKMLKTILKNGLLTLNIAEKKFDVKYDHYILSQPKLSVIELLHLTSAFEFAIFTGNYKIFAEADNAHSLPISNSTTPTGKTCSRSIEFLVNYILDYLKVIRDKARLHMIFLTRTMLQNTNAILLKLTMDLKNIEEQCERNNCMHEKETNFNDRVYIMGVNQMIKRGMGAVDNENQEMEEAFNKFYKDNEDTIIKFVKVYT